MKRGCIVIGELQCDSCNRPMQHGERYLLIEENEGQKSRFCVDCCLNKGYATYVKEKGERVITFFPPVLH